MEDEIWRHDMETHPAHSIMVIGMACSHTLTLLLNLFFRGLDQLSPVEN